MPLCRLVEAGQSEESSYVSLFETRTSRRFIIIILIMQRSASRRLKRLSWGRSWFSTSRVWNYSLWGVFLWRPAGRLLFVSSFNEERHPRLLSLRSNVHLAASQRTWKASEAWTYVTFFSLVSARWQNAIRSFLRFLVTVGVFDKRRLRSPVTTSWSERGGSHFRTRFISSKQNGCQRDSTVMTLNKSVRREADGDFALKQKSLQARLNADDVEFKDVYCVVLSADATKDNKTSK